MRYILSIVVSVLGIAVMEPALRAQAPLQANYDKPNQVWSLSNGLIEARYRLNDQRLFRLISLGRPGGKHWVEGGRPVSSPIDFTIDDNLLDQNTPWDLIDTTTESAANGGGLRQVIRLRNSDAAAEVDLYLEIYPNQPFVRTFYTYVNLDQAPHDVRAASFLDLRLNTEGRQMRAFYVSQTRSGTPLNFDTSEALLSLHRVSVYAGAYADDCTWLALRDDADNGMVFGWEFDGRSRVLAHLLNAGNVAVVSGGPLELNIPVAAGDQVALPAAFMGLYEGDWDEAGYRTQRFTEAVLAAPMPDGNFPYLMYNTWGYEENIDETTVRQAAQIAASIGAEVFVVDLGWARQIGQWQRDRVKFPDGLDAISDYVHSLGMKFGLHFVPSEASSEAPVLIDHPDWTSTVNDSYFGSESICLTHAAVQSWVRANALRLVRRLHLDWVAQDGENLVKDCEKDTHTHNPYNSNWANSVGGIDAFVQYMRDQAPQAFWENNADGGTMSTFEAVKRYATFGSCDACEHQPRRQAVYGMSYVFPPRFISRYMGEAPIKFTTRSSMFGGPWIMMQRLTELTRAQIDLLRQEGALYKSLRPLIRDGKVYHLLPRPDGYSIEAIESFNPDWNRGVVFVYRPNSSASSQVIYPRGLDPNANYSVSFQESHDTFTASGASLMTSGIKVKLPSVLFAEIVYINGQ